jgi:hypothetical protein
MDPTVPGLPAEVGVECPSCGWVALMPVGELARCPTCGGTAGVTWAEGATPDVPVASLTCPCGVVQQGRIGCASSRHCRSKVPMDVSWMLGWQPWPAR